MGMGSPTDSSSHTTLSEINVTPLVDVMLVLLTIFMVASSVETIQVAAEREKLLKERQEEEQRTLLLERLERVEEREELEQTFRRREQRRMQFMQLQEEKLKEMEEELEDRSQNVPIELPKANSEAVNLGEQKKIVVTFTREHEFFIGDTRVVDCNAAEFVGAVGNPAGEKKPAEKNPGGDALTLPEAQFGRCLDAIARKLVANEKLKSEGECYLRADRKLDYGEVLRLMATIRKAGITKFGLIAEELQEEENAGNPAT
jgi:biopolymer transport protein ExbD